ncbi:AMP-binding protein [Bradyrhizobium sp.]|uniref:AMP-binding protein n=1 Tax=Bradyrhizobium sp. TaxID=376 RepID=UPI0027175169|nr:AMP-binding protein [Bradyrhizobium sp.]MDO9295065.1 AMP-binding protein [Bradyrhizobium sp.]
MDRTSAFAWQPNAALSQASNAAAFMHVLGVDSWEAMVRCGDEDPERFHRVLLDHFGFRFYRPYSAVVDETRGPAWASWCVGGTTNVVLNVLDRWRGTPTYDKPLLDWEGEDGARRTLTYREIDREVCRLAGGLRGLGLGPGDVVAIYLPNVPEAMVAMLAVAKIGAVVMPLFSGFGADAVASRLATGGAKAIITIDASLRRGKVVNAFAVVDEAAALSPAVEHVIVLRHTGAPVDWRSGRDHWWDELCATQPDTASTQEMDAEAPYLLVFTSGTTGQPKGVVHSHIGFTAKLVLDLWLLLDCKPSDRVFWMSDMGWIIGPLIVFGTPLVGATLVLVEGAPNYPDPDRMWRIIERQRITYLGVAPTTVRGFMAQGSAPAATYDLSSLRMLISAGEAWTPEAWWWFFQQAGGGRLPILNFSGGTEMISIIGTTVLLPLKCCGFNCALPGTGADILDESGASAMPGAVGELVMRRPSIGLTRGIWRDEVRYLQTYWSTWPGIWHHGDFASRDADGQWYIHGRSDDTMKIAGKRTGPDEIEALALATGQIADAAAIAVPDPIKGSALVLVCVPKPGASDPDALRDKLERAVTQGLGTPFRPSRVIFVSDLPRTRNMKIMRRVIRAVCAGEEPGDQSALVNPEAVLELRMRIGNDPDDRRRRAP